MNDKKTVIVIAGPTAAGKTELAIRLALHLQTEIISADSRQCYHELNIGVARPSTSELASVPHHFIASHSIYEKVTAATFEAFALAKTLDLLESHATVVMVGGTGLYIDAFCHGLDAIPPIPETTRAALTVQYNEEGLQWLQKEVALRDPKYYAEGELQNPHRLLRALEVMMTTGRSIQEFKQRREQQRPFSILKFALAIPKETLQHRIDQRVDAMMDNGLLSEAESLLAVKHLPALQTVGYKELFSFLDGEMDLPAAVAAIKLHTRQYAKRQRTWFRRDARYQHLEVNNAAHFEAQVLAQLATAK